MLPNSRLIHLAIICQDILTEFDKRASTAVLPEFKIEVAISNIGTGVVKASVMLQDFQSKHYNLEVNGAKSSVHQTAEAILRQVCIDIGKQYPADTIFLVEPTEII